MMMMMMIKMSAIVGELRSDLSVVHSSSIEMQQFEVMTMLVMLIHLSFTCIYISRLGVCECVSLSLSLCFSLSPLILIS